MATDRAPGMDLLPWPGRGFGLGFTVLRDPAAANSPEPAGTWRLGGAYGHSWFVDRANGLTAVAFTNAGRKASRPADGSRMISPTPSMGDRLSGEDEPA